MSALEVFMWLVVAVCGAAAAVSIYIIGLVAVVATKTLVVRSRLIQQKLEESNDE